MPLSAVVIEGIDGINSILCESDFFGYESAVDRPKTDGEAAYNYSVHLIRDLAAGEYRLYHGGRWKSNIGDGDHVLQTHSQFGAASTWPVADHPEFLQGQEEGTVGQWFSNNYLEPEVIKVNGTYYMYTQVEIDPGSLIDIPGMVADGMGCDRIQLHTSSDGKSWSRWSMDRGVIINIDDPTHASMHHQEALYVPWDSDGRPFWMYVFRSGGGQDEHYRLRSSDPTTFDWSQREGTGFPQLGNQIGYAKEAPDDPLFVRITFDDDGSGRLVPCLHFSRDRLSWSWGDKGRILLDGSKDNADNKNCYFLGISTQDGTGLLDSLGSNQFHFLYGATTSNSAVQPEIYKSQIGVGACRLTINPPASWLDSKLIVCDGLPLALVIGGKRLQFANPVGFRFSKQVVNVSSAFYNTIPYGASLSLGAKCIGTGQPACFVLDDGRKWPVSCIEAITDIGSSIQEVSLDEYNSYPTGPSLICM
jgi:hypothetical protein